MKYGKMTNSRNIDQKVVDDFGKEWERFDQSSGLSDYEKKQHFEDYFSIFPWSKINSDSIGFDAGCGSGRWASLIAPRVGHLHCIDPSSAIEVAKMNLRRFSNCSFHKCAIDEMKFSDLSMDFGYSLGVLHHMPDPLEGMRDCVKKLKKGAPFLIYLYYAMDNQPIWYRYIWKITDVIRRCISILPSGPKIIITNLIAGLIYYPLSKLALVIEGLGFAIHSWPLSNYRDKSFYTMRTDALDRFGTRLEHRFTKREIIELMESSGLIDIKVSDSVPFYCAVGIKK